ncbi:hypothetical protein [Morganella morganii IS15]|nr:hypothetical protein CSB69_1779 [Morganella morganii]EMP53641.1 hypothetical protein C790_00157 [Morganella morganii SC01]CDK67460.1 hypothetical protein [Morganella morganii IS15]
MAGAGCITLSYQDTFLLPVTINRYFLNNGLFCAKKISTGKFM